MAVHFSKSMMAFFPDTLRAAYEKNGCWPEDAVPIADELYERVALLRPVESTLVINPNNGLPDLTDSPRPSPAHWWNGAAWEATPAAEAECQRANAERELDRRRAAADAAIAPLEDAVELGMATADELAALKAWKRCRVLLTRVPQQAGYPGAVDWPSTP
ncbi:tail fiber assembly protein [Chromobacterium haemolyticum]|uniref:tail fiber assembly protein n=1 Tax=Chromobacterium haemolyticum TaxID=394935 RepID=UPI0002EEB74E|nr:tail fiber assembly protein [Chromobacterium haemolyticum]